MRHYVYMFFVFLCGVVATVNLVRLVPTNSLYEAAWYKVAIAVFIAVAFAYKAKK